MPLILSKEQIVLINNSEEAKDIETYGNLYDILSKYDNLSHNDLENDNAFDEIAKLILKYSKEKLLENVLREWEAYKYDDVAEFEEDIHCQLCGTKNIYIYYIRNKINSIELNVGSSCIRKFPEIQGYSEQKKKHASSDKAKREQNRIISFNKKYPDTKEYLKENRRKFDEFPILLPWELYKSINSQIIKMQLFYNEFTMNGDIKKMDSILETYKDYQILLVDMWKKASQFLISNEHVHNICKRQEYRWLIAKKNFTLLEKIARNNGLYNHETIQGVYSREFLFNMQSLIEKSCQGTDIEFKEINDDADKLIFQINDKAHNGKIEVSISYKNFMEYWGCKIYFDSSFRILLISNIVTLENTKENIGIVLTRINKVIARTNDNIKYTYDDEKDELYIEKGIDRTYKRINIKTMLDQYKNRLKFDDLSLRNTYLLDYESIKKSPMEWKSIEDRLTSGAIERYMSKRK